jgi:hypothetical protein
MHVGYEWRAGRKVPLHDQRAIDSVLEFARDFKPGLWLDLGDALDLGPISHWRKQASDRKSVEGLRLDKDIDTYRRDVYTPINDIMRDRGSLPKWARPQVFDAAGKRRVKRNRIRLRGNHEDWLYQFIDANPELDGLLNLERELDTEAEGWESATQGGVVQFPHLLYLHGDTLRGPSPMSAVNDYGTNIRYGHFHTYAAVTKHSPVDAGMANTGVSLGCLCNRAPAYGKRAANRWLKGFSYGWMFEDGTFTDLFPVIIDGKFAAEGRTYKG